MYMCIAIRKQSSGFSAALSQNNSKQDPTQEFNMITKTYKTGTISNYLSELADRECIITELTSIICDG